MQTKEAVENSAASFESEDGMKAVLFDLDGTLVDSMWIWSTFLTDYLEACFQITPTEEMCDAVRHMSLQQSSVYVKEELRLSETPEEIRAAWMDMVYDAYANKIRLKPFVREYIHRLRGEGVKIGLVTACDMELCKACLSGNRAEKLFDAVIYADEVGAQKSEPEIYLAALEKLGTEPKDAALFDDIITAIRAAKKAGLYTVAVLDENSNKNEALKGAADTYISDFSECLERKLW